MTIYEYLPFCFFEFLTAFKNTFLRLPRNSSPRKQLGPKDNKAMSKAESMI